MIRPTARFSGLGWGLSAKWKIVEMSYSGATGGDPWLSVPHVREQEQEARRQTGDDAAR